MVTRKLLFVLLFFLAGILIHPSGGFALESIYNDHFRISIETSADEFRLKSIDLLDGPDQTIFSFNTEDSPIWQIDIRKILEEDIPKPYRITRPHSETSSDCVEPSGSECGMCTGNDCQIFIPDEKIPYHRGNNNNTGSLDYTTTSDQIVLEWEDLNVLDFGGNNWLNLNVVVTITRDNASDGGMSWNIHAWLVKGPDFTGNYAIHNIKFPCLVVAALEPGRPDREKMLFPYSGGALISNPRITNLGEKKNLCTDQIFKMKDYEDSDCDLTTCLKDEDDIIIHEVTDDQKCQTGNYKLNYPGQISTQMMAYYRRSLLQNRPNAGIYIAAKDKAGYVKRLYFDGVTGNARYSEDALMMYIKHYNFAVYDPDGEGTDGVTADLRTFYLDDPPPDELTFDYLMAVDVFEGDWMTAADLYRAWVKDDSPEGGQEFIGQPLEDKTNMVSDRLKEPHFSFLYHLENLSPFSLSQSMAADGSSAAYDPDFPWLYHYDRIVSLLDWYRQVIPEGYDAELNVLCWVPKLWRHTLMDFAKMNLWPDRMAAKDIVPFDYYDNFQALQSNFIRFIDLLSYQLALFPNIDTGSWSIESEQRVDEVYCDDEYFSSYPFGDERDEQFLGSDYNWGIIRREMGIRTFSNVGCSDGMHHYTGCAGSEWIKQRRYDKILKIFNCSRFTNCQDMGSFAGFMTAVLSGIGPVSNPCWTPLWEEPGTEAHELHQHRPLGTEETIVGGGHYQVDGLNQLIEEIRQEWDTFFPMAEREHEHLIKNHFLNVRYQYPESKDVQSDTPNEMHGDYVPLMPYLYHEYAFFWRMNLPLEAWSRLNGNHGFEDYCGWKYYQALDFIEGSLLSIQAISDLKAGPLNELTGDDFPVSPPDTPCGNWKSYLMDTRYDGLFEERGEKEQKTMAFHRLLTLYRVLLPEFLCYGKMCRPPHLYAPELKHFLRFIVSAGWDSDNCRFKEKSIQDKYYYLPKIHTSGWEKDGDAGLIFVNYTDEAVENFHFTFVPADYGLEGGETYYLYKINEQGEAELFGGASHRFDGSDALYTSPEMTFPPNSVLAIKIVTEGITQGTPAALDP